MHPSGQKELLEDVHEKDLCVGCGACVDLCPYLKTYKGKTTMIFPCDLLQGRCYAFCPKTEVDQEELSKHIFGKSYEGSPIGHYREIAAGRAGERMSRGLYQAGGAVSALTAFALEKSLIDSAVLTDRDGLVPVPRIVTGLEEVIECATSKYTAAPTVSAVNRGVKKGYSRMGVVGTPCQVTALGQMGLNPTNIADFRNPVALIIGLFCTWALDTRKLIALLNERLDITDIKKTDIPPPPSEIFIVETSENKLEIPLDDIRPLVPRGCMICPDMTSEYADVSIGVMEEDPDWNTLILRTERGAEIVKEAVEGGWLVTKGISREALDHLAFAAGNKKKRALKMADEEGLLNTSGKKGRSSLRISDKIVKKIFGGQEV